MGSEEVKAAAEKLLATKYEPVYLGENHEGTQVTISSADYGTLVNFYDRALRVVPQLLGALKQAQTERDRWRAFDSARRAAIDVCDHPDCSEAAVIPTGNCMDHQ